MRNINKILFIVGKNNKIGLLILLLVNLINFFLEFLSLISIPIFVSVLLKDDLQLNKINFIFNNISEENLLFYSTSFVIISFLLKNILLSFNAYYQARYLKEIRSFLSKRFFNFYFENVSSDQILVPSIMARNVTNSIQGFYAYCENLNKFVRDLAAVITIAIIILFINLKIGTLLLIIFIILILTYSSFLKPKIKKRSEENQRLVAKFNKMIFETFEAIKDIKVYQKEKIVKNLFDQKVDNFEKNFFFFNVFDKLPRIFLELITIFSILIVSLAYFKYTDNIFQVLPILALIIVSAIRLIPAFSGITTALFYLRVYTPSLDIVYNQIKIIRSNKIKLNDNKNLKKIYKDNIDLDKNYLIIDDISFSYDKGKKLLENINIRIPKNSFVSIIGPSGSGKTTLQSIIMGLINPDKGNIFFRNKNIFLNYDRWIEKISFVSQKVFLFNDTIKKNICLNFDESEIDKDRLEMAIDIAELKDKIKSLNHKLEENVGSDGSKLSGGERQRIALARAIYKKSEILFLDEFTSNLDINTEKKIVKKIKNFLPDVTVVMITHRPEIAQTSDIVFELDN